MDPIDALNKEVEELNKQLAASRNDLLRAYADTDNTRKRLIKEADTAKSIVSSPLLLNCCRF